MWVNVIQYKSYFNKTVIRLRKRNQSLPIASYATCSMLLKTIITLNFVTNKTRANNN